MSLSYERPPSGCKTLAILQKTKTFRGTRGLCAQQRRWAQPRGLWSCSRRGFSPGCEAIRRPWPGADQDPIHTPGNPTAGRRGSASRSAAGGRPWLAAAWLVVPATGRVAFKKMSLSGGESPAWPATRLSWLLCCSALLSPAAGYVIVSSVSWAVTNEVDEELDSASTEEALPALLEDSSSIWQQSFPASAHKEDTHLRPRGSARARPAPAARGMFSYRRESGSSEASPGPRVHAGTARSLAHASSWGCLATVSTHEKVNQRSGGGGGARLLPRTQGNSGFTGAWTVNAL